MPSTLARPAPQAQASRSVEIGRATEPDGAQRRARPCNSEDVQRRHTLPFTGGLSCDLAACGYTRNAGEQGDPCTELNDCGDGFQCVNGASVPDCDAARCCTTFCALDDPDGCAALEATSCRTELPLEACPPALYRLGACFLPPGAAAPLEATLDDAN